MSLKIAILGWPLIKTLSPSIHNMLAKLSSVDLVYEKLSIENLDAEKLDDIHSKYDGYNVTIPHKRKIYDLIKSKDSSKITETARGTQSVNTVVLKNSIIHATNTDIEGMKKTFESINYDLRNKKILILGNGGSAQTFKYFCDSSNEVTVASRKKDKNTKANDISSKTYVFLNLRNISALIHPIKPAKNTASNPYINGKLIAKL